MLFDVSVNVMPLPALLDPQGKAIRATLGQIGFPQVQDVRVGKHFSIRVEADSESDAQRIANEISAKLLSNPVMEGFATSVDPVQQ